MSGKILDGKAETENVLAAVAAEVELLRAGGKKACLAAVQANADPGSDWYARAQAKHCQVNGVDYRHIRLPADAPEIDIIAALRAASKDPDVSGIILLTPLPPGVDHLNLAEAIDPKKDAEGVHPANMGRLLVSADPDAGPTPCTAMAALRLIFTARPNLSGARALVIGRSATVGKPLALLLLGEHATVTVAHTRSELRPLLLDAEIVVAAAGATGARWRAYEKKWRMWRKNGGDRPALPNLEPLVTVDMVRRGAIVIDIGDNSVPAGLDDEGKPVLNAEGKPDMRYAGDVDFEKVREVAGFITKSRGSVGPLTNAYLLRNVVRSALDQWGLWLDKRDDK